MVMFWIVTLCTLEWLLSLRKNILPPSSEEEGWKQQVPPKWWILRLQAVIIQKTTV
jgi:hypothetical protein